MAIGLKLATAERLAQESQWIFGHLWGIKFVAAQGSPQSWMPPMTSGTGGHSPVMGLGLSRNLSGGPFSFRLSGNTWLFWVVCSCKMRKYERQGWGLGLLWGQGCHQDGPGQGKGGT